MRIRLRHRHVWALLMVSAFGLAGCPSSRGTPAADRPSDSSSTTMTVPTSTSTTTAPPPRAIRMVDWTNAAVPAAACGGSGSVQLHDSAGLVSSSRWPDAWQGNDPPQMPSQVRISSADPVRYGDLDGDSRDEAFVPIWCDNGGGTGAGQLGQSLVVFSGSPDALTLTGIVTPSHTDHQMAYFDNSATRIAPRRITVEELFYGPNDSTCCPTGRAEAVWTLTGTTLSQTSSHVTTHPAP